MDRMGLLVGVAAEDNRYLSTGCGAVRHERSRGNTGYQTVAVRPAHCFSSPRLDRSRVCVAIECCAALRRMTAIGIVAVQDGRQLLTGDQCIRLESAVGEAVDNAVSEAHAMASAYHLPSATSVNCAVEAALLPLMR